MCDFVKKVHEICIQFYLQISYNFTFTVVEQVGQQLSVIMLWQITTVYRILTKVVHHCFTPIVV